MFGKRLVHLALHLVHLALNTSNQCYTLFVFRPANLQFLCDEAPEGAADLLRVARENVPPEAAGRLGYQSQDHSPTHFNSKRPRRSR